MKRRTKGHAVSFGPNNKPLATQDMTDAGKLVWGEFAGPMNAAVAQINAATQAAQNALAKALAPGEGVDPRQGWVLNVPRMRWEKRPVPQEVE